MSDREDSSQDSNIQKDHTNSLTHTFASEYISSSYPILNQSQAGQPQPLTIALPRTTPSYLESGWTLIEPDLSLRPPVTTSLGHRPAGLKQDNFTGPSTSPGLTSPKSTQPEVPSHQLSKFKRSRSSASSSQAETAPSANTEPTASQIARRVKLDRQDLELREIARTIAADEDSDSDSDSDWGSSQLDMTEKVRKDLEDDFMFIDRGHLKDDPQFMKTVTKVMETDRTSVNHNEATLVYFVLPIMMSEEFTAQDVGEDGQGEGDFKERSFVIEGVVCELDHLFDQRYCLPHRNMNVPSFRGTMLKDLFDSKPHLTTPKPDFVYGLSKDKLPTRPPDVVSSDELDKLLNIAPIRDVFFVWENKSGAGNLMKCGNDALKDTSALIYARRQIYAFMNRPLSPGIDTDTYIYAATNTNKMIEFYVAYAWLPKDLSRVEFCMDRIGAEDFTIDELKDNRSILPCLRKPLHNIIEWGSVTRIPKLIEFYKRLWKVQREKSDESLKEKDAEKKSSKKQKTSC
ncbi:MAG: hypothetical protein Q9171_004632 [Xanthocarpia ochracea]